MATPGSAATSARAFLRSSGRAVLRTLAHNEGTLMLSVCGGLMLHLFASIYADERHEQLRRRTALIRHHQDRSDMSADKMTRLMASHRFWSTAAAEMAARSRLRNDDLRDLHSATDRLSHRNTHTGSTTKQSAPQDDRSTRQRLTGAVGGTQQARSGSSSSSRSSSSSGSNSSGSSSSSNDNSSSSSGPSSFEHKRVEVATIIILSDDDVGQQQQPQLDSQAHTHLSDQQQEQQQLQQLQQQQHQFQLRQQQRLQGVFNLTSWVLLLPLQPLLSWLAHRRASIAERRVQLLVRKANSAADSENHWRAMHAQCIARIKRWTAWHPRSLALQLSSKVGGQVVVVRAWAALWLDDEAEALQNDTATVGQHGDWQGHVPITWTSASLSPMQG
ncbi:MAG: hypothetical protein WDW38_007838 [Sanguina aurantia]